MNDLCKETVYPKETWGSFHGHRCTRKAIKDGYCKIHHPDSVKERQEKASKRYNEKIQQSPMGQLIIANKRLRWCYDKTMSNMVKPIMSFEDWLGNIDKELEKK